MDESSRWYHQAVRRTYVVRPPRQTLATFGVTAIRYYLVAEPVYAGLDLPGSGAEETVVREGVVRAERPQVITPYYLMRHEGFGDNATRYLERIVRALGPDAPGLLYHYRNLPKDVSIVSGRPSEVALRISERLDREQRPLEAVVRGVDHLWDVSLMKFIYELTDSSARANASELDARGLLELEGGVPRAARRRIEQLVDDARRGAVDPAEVHRELVQWGLFDEYQDLFLEIFRRR